MLHPGFIGRGFALSPGLALAVAFQEDHHNVGRHAHGCLPQGKA